MPSTAPSAAPDEAPRMSGETSGLRNRPWNAVPATASAPPTSTAATTRGPRTSSTTCPTVNATRSPSARRPEIGGVAAPGDAAYLGPAADVGQQELAFLRPVGARPADEQFGRERVEKDRRRRSRQKDALDTRWHRHGAAGAIGHARGARTPRRQHRGRETGEQCAAIDTHVAHV